MKRTAEIGSCQSKKSSNFLMVFFFVIQISKARKLHNYHDLPWYISCIIALHVGDILRCIMQKIIHKEHVSRVGICLIAERLSPKRHSTTAWKETSSK